MKDFSKNSPKAFIEAVTHFPAQLLARSTTTKVWRDLCAQATPASNANFIHGALSCGFNLAALPCIFRGEHVPTWRKKQLQLSHYGLENTKHNFVPQVASTGKHISLRVCGEEPRLQQPPWVSKVALLSLGACIGAHS